MAFLASAQQNLSIRMIVLHEILPIEVAALAAVIPLSLDYYVDDQGIHGTLEGRDTYVFEALDPVYMSVENMGPNAVAAYLKAQVKAFVQQVRDLVLDAPPVQQNFFFTGSVLQSLFPDPKSLYIIDLKGKS